MSDQIKAPALNRKQMIEDISNNICLMVDTANIVVPNGYSVGNALKSAFLLLQDTVDKNGKPAMDVCTATSIQSSFLKMVTQGLNPALTQCYFIVYGKNLTFQRSYFGSMALGKRIANVKEPNANVIYLDDIYVSEIDVNTGRRKLLKHESPFENRDDKKIKGAYCIVLFKDGSSRLEEMTMAEIKAAWGMGNARGNSPAHNNFAGEMSKKTVITRALKVAINSAIEDPNMDDDSDELGNVAQEELKQEVKGRANKTEVKFDDFEEMGVEDPEKKPEPVEKQKNEAKPKSLIADQEKISFD